MVRRAENVLLDKDLFFPLAQGKGRNALCCTWDRNKLIYEYQVLFYLVNLALVFSIDNVTNHRFYQEVVSDERRYKQH